MDWGAESTEEKTDRKRFNATDDSEKESLRAIWQELKAEHSVTLGNAGHFCWHRRRTWKATKRFFWEPFQFSRGLFEHSHRKGARKNIWWTHTQMRWGTSTQEIRWSSISKKAHNCIQYWTASMAWSQSNDEKGPLQSPPGQNGVSYTVYKPCPNVIKSIHWLLQVKLHMQGVKTGERNAQL